jgi:hypothetical protein
MFFKTSFFCLPDLNARLVKFHPYAIGNYPTIFYAIMQLLYNGKARVDFVAHYRH